ncbi:hypothetical protein [Mesorhizobium sp. M7A.F.Ce.TU.012.03.2.1]|uniref:hypothetical protein n=1 Tax=Mesorhizobium sp. M7A.F.Ce.TU.012.03.2.1 TaxID=2493681 RepID=UPI000FDC9AAC|nr:hypothetical protein [Mesorhizobium sp. M7A.F.Ce.TU.012.03.2.1]AZV21595.1 hypothetical protein EJ079_22420 [Mesorhizobium sp. M7A.F.Ce.TU.012.03.2.1]
MQIFLVLAGVAELGFGILVFADGPAITQQIAGLILVCAGVVTLGLSELINIGQRIARAVEAKLVDAPLLPSLRTQTYVSPNSSAYGGKAKVCSFCGHNNSPILDICHCGKPLTT